MKRTISVTAPPAVQEILSKIYWHLASINSLAGHLSDLGFPMRLKTTYTKTGKPLLVIDRN